MTENLAKYGDGVLKGIDAYRGNIAPALVLDPAAYNVLQGINDGTGPRYGMAPIPGHSDYDAPGANQFPGLMRWDKFSQSLTGGGTTWTRAKVYGIIPIRLRDPGAVNIGTTSTYYAVIIGYQTSVQAGTFIDVLLLAIKDGGGFIQHSSIISSGLPYAGADSITPVSNAALIAEKLSVPTTSQGSFAIYVTGQRTALFTLMKNIIGNNWVSAAPFSVSGPNVNMNWLLGGANNFPDATHPPRLNFTDYVSAGTGNPIVFAGIPSPINYGGMPTAVRTITVYCLAQLAYQNMNYTAKTQASSVYNPVYLENGQSAFDGTGFAWTKGDAGTSYNGVEGALLNDPAMTMNASYQGIAVAAGKPILTIFQDWYRSPNGEMQQYVDLTALPMPEADTSNIAFGAANSGILRANTTYEFGVSVYDKRLNYETNVVSVTTQKTGATDYVNAVIFDTANFGVSTAAVNGGGVFMKMPFLKSGWNVSTSQPQHINYMEYRLYYRQVGMSEWLPGLFIDAAQFWFYPKWTNAGSNLAMCTGAIGGLPGGRVGGFNDYSQLPSDTYACTIVYKNRLFWLSEKSLYFSLINNFFAYPGRNSAAAPVGSFKGALVHAYRGQAKQDARLVIFTTKGTMVGTFTGNLLQVPITVSAGPPGGPPVIPNFGLDGSDFVILPWSDFSAFSYRSAIVAEGDLYVWGPEGIFVDNGVNELRRISNDIEPNLFTLYDPSKTDQICCSYNFTTKEIVWFYPPKVADAAFPTYGLVYNRGNGTFLPIKMPCQVDDVTQLHIDTAIATAGKRTVVFARQNAGTSISRAFFFDFRNRGGDHYPGGELMIKAFTSPSASVRRMTLANGDAGVGVFSINDLVCLDQLASYSTGLISPQDFIGTVGAVGATTIDVNLPASLVGVLDATYTAAGNATYFPIYHATATGQGVNGIPWNMPFKYWMPAGPNSSFLWWHLYLRFVANLLPYVKPEQITLKYRTPVSSVVSSDGFQADQLGLVNNSDGNCQIYHNLNLFNRSIEGQALRVGLSGNHIGHQWVLQWLEMHGIPQVGDLLKEFEG